MPLYVSTKKGIHVRMKPTDKKLEKLPIKQSQLVLEKGQFRNNDQEFRHWPNNAHITMPIEHPSMKPRNPMGGDCVIVSNRRESASREDHLAKPQKSKLTLGCFLLSFSQAEITVEIPEVLRDQIETCIKCLILRKRNLAQIINYLS